MLENLAVGLSVAGAVLFLIWTVRAKKQAICDPHGSGCGGCCEGCLMEVQKHGNERPSNDNTPRSG